MSYIWVRPKKLQLLGFYAAGQLSIWIEVRTIRGSLGGSEVWCLPLLWGGILESWSPRIGSCIGLWAWSLLLPLPVSLCLSWINKWTFKEKESCETHFKCRNTQMCHHADQGWRSLPWDSHHHVMNLKRHIKGQVLPASMIYWPFSWAPYQQSEWKPCHCQETVLQIKNALFYGLKWRQYYWSQVCIKDQCRC